ncbi:MAG: hypothetical protein AB7F36_05090, partial [Reyranellaceae bacterium]
MLIESMRIFTVPEGAVLRNRLKTPAGRKDRPVMHRYYGVPARIFQRHGCQRNASAVGILPLVSGK